MTAGGRRLAALNLLAEAGEIAKDYPIECKERSGCDATEISLIENTSREAMHPVDEYEAFRVLADGGKLVEDIAARFGTTETMVRKRLALARVSPALLDLYRNEEMSFQQLPAFTVSERSRKTSGGLEQPADVEPRWRRMKSISTRWYRTRFPQAA